MIITILSSVVIYSLNCYTMRRDFCLNQGRIWGGRPPTNRGPPTKPLNFLANDRCFPSLVILIEDFEINEN